MCFCTFTLADSFALLQFFLGNERESTPSRTNSKFFPRDSSDDPPCVSAAVPGTSSTLKAEDVPASLGSVHNSPAQPNGSNDTVVGVDSCSETDVGTMPVSQRQLLDNALEVARQSPACIQRKKELVEIAAAADACVGVVRRRVSAAMRARRLSFMAKRILRAWPLSSTNES